MNGIRTAVRMALVLAWLVCKAYGGGTIPLAALNGSTFVKITTTNYGLQFIAATDLANLLAQPAAAIQSAIAQGMFQLATGGQPVTWLASPNGSNLLFYAENHRDNYSTNNIYWLTYAANGTVAGENGQAPAPATGTPWYLSSSYYEDDQYYEFSLPLSSEQNPWMTYELVSGVPLSWPYSANMDHLTQGGDRPGQLAVQLWGGDTTTHTIQVSVNSSSNVVNFTWTGLVPTNCTWTIPSAWLVAGANKFTFAGVASNGSPVHSLSWVNGFTVGYPRTFNTVNGLLDFTANGNSVITVDGFANTNVTVLDVTNPKQPLLVTNVTIDQPGATYRVSFVPAGAGAHYVASQTGWAIPVMSLGVGQVAGLTSSTNAADYIIVSPPSLLTAATNLATYRQQRGLRTLIAPLDEVCNEFGYGFPTPHAVQALAAMAWTNWLTAPHYLVLLGKGSYDFLNIDNQNGNLMPPLMVSTPFGVFASDSLMGAVNSNGLPVIAVGRLSGLTTNDINVLINKIKTYERAAAPAVPAALLAADVPDSAGNFQDEILQVAGALGSTFTNTILFSASTTNPEPVHSEILTQWYEGVDFVNYAGHGAVSQFGGAGYLSDADATNSTNYFLLNCPRLPFVTAMTCVCGQFSIPGEWCLGEYLLAPTNGGAIAFFGPTGLSLSLEANELDVRLAAYLQANAQLGLGDMVRQAMADHISQDLPTVPVWIYNLLGDPALHYDIPRTLATLEITSWTTNSLGWAGGLAPYQVEATTNLLNAASWQPVGPPILANQMFVTNNQPAEFYRVQSSQ